MSFWGNLREFGLRSPTKCNGFSWILLKRLLLVMISVKFSLEGVYINETNTNIFFTRNPFIKN